MHGHMFFLHIDENPWRQAMCHYLPIVALATGVVAQLDLCSQRAKHDLHCHRRKKEKNVFMQIYHDTLVVQSRTLQSSGKCFRKRFQE